jgi:hypothetical protein
MAVAKLYESRIEDDTILCNLDQFASLLKVRFSDIHDLIEEYINKKYFEEIHDPDLPFEGIILKVNPALLPEIEAELISTQKEEFTEQLIIEMSSENLEQKYEYSQTLVNRLSLLESPELRHTLERDLREAVMSLATQSYKSALILCGSIVEATLMDRLLTRQVSALQSYERLQIKVGKTVRAKDKNIKEWSLNTLLDVAHEENIISTNLYHWGHGIRGFRNLVHPAVEQRKEMEVSRENAEVAWSVVKRLLKELI